MSKIIECDVCGKRDYEDNYSRAASVSEITHGGLKPRERCLWVTFLIQDNGDDADEDVDICPACRVAITKRALEQYVKDHEEWFTKDADTPILPLLTEGKVRKGGVNSPPTTPKPNGRPGAQGKR